MQRNLYKFLAQEDGAVTVDWVVLTAAIVSLGLLVLIPIGLGTTNLASVVGTYIGGVPVGQ